VIVIIREFADIQIKKMDESEGTSIDVTNDSENSDVGEGLFNCYGSPVGHITVSH